jgi:sphingolipid delta-4 desaturase
MGKGGNRVTPEPVVTVFPAADNTEDFVYSNTDEPHISRRKQILAKHPEIEKLFVPDSRPVPYVVATVVVQLLFAYSAQYMSKSVFLFCAWLIGGGITHCLSLMTHEVSHNLVFKSNEANMYLGIFCNIGMGFPSSTMFKRYHMEHHQFQVASEDRRVG